MRKEVLDLEDIRSLAALREHVRGRGRRLLRLHYPRHPELDTDLLMEGENATGIRSKLAPGWDVTLMGAGIPPATLAAALRTGGSFAGAAQVLIANNVIGSENLEHLAAGRLTSVLMALMLTEPPELSVRAVQEHQGGGVRTPVRDALKRARFLALNASDEARRLEAADRFRPSATTLMNTGDKRAGSYGLLSQGLPLGEVAGRSALHWDTLTRQVISMNADHLLLRQGEAPRGGPYPGLRSGDVAPDFRLRDLTGDVVQLSSLRGQRVWLTFHAGVNCAPCLHRHAESSAMQAKTPLDTRILSVWTSPEPALRAMTALDVGLIPLLADPLAETHERYGVARRQPDPGTEGRPATGGVLSGLRRLGGLKLSEVGSALRAARPLSRLPAEFLISPEGLIEEAHYSAHWDDWLPLTLVRLWGQRVQDEEESVTGGGISPSDLFVDG